MSGVAVIGLACRFPGARDAAQYWENLVGGVESIERLGECDEGGPRGRQGYVAAAPVLAGVDRFDAAFFGCSPREAALLDPQHRVFLECAWAAFEHAGYDTSRYRGAIGVYASCALNTYLLFSGAADRLRDDYLTTVVAADKDFLATRTSYKLGLTGPSMNVQSACSSSLVAVHVACQSLLGGECEMALAGAVSVRVPQRAGYLHEPGGVLSPDGHCRPFDARAAGTLFGSGVGAVVLKPLDVAVADGDRVHAVVRGSAVNNDGSAKLDYEAPSIRGQAEAIEEALAHADVPAETIGYVEAHGTGTQVGDPVEVEALARAFGSPGGDPGSCVLGSVKGNFGHLDAAAGIAGLIKAVLMLERGLIPPTLHFEHPNSAIAFERTPFRISARLERWPHAGHPRRAGVSSLGIGGTNAHVVLEEAPRLEPPVVTSRSHELLVLSARTESAADGCQRNLADALAADGTGLLADVAYTLQVGRRAFRHRRAVVCSDTAEAVAVLRDGGRVLAGTAAAKPPRIVFAFPGGGSQYPGMGASLRTAEPAFRAAHEEGVGAARALGVDLRDTAEHALRRPSLQLPAIFVLERALAALWRSWGVEPAALAGYSMGELTAAHVSGVLGLDDALRLIIARGRVLERAGGHGAMLSVGLREHDLATMLDGEVDVAAIDTPDTCVVSGPADAVGALATALAKHGIAARPVPITTAAHSRLLDPALDEWEEAVRSVQLVPPSLPVISNVSGGWLTDADAVDPRYWRAQLRSTVRFADGARTLLQDPATAVLEVGPGRALTSFTRRVPGAPAAGPFVESLPRPVNGRDEVCSVLTALGSLWLAGAPIDWPAVHSEPRRRVPLPSYPFAGERYWLEPSSRSPMPVPKPVRSLSHEEVDDQRFDRSSSDSEPDGDDGTAPRTAIERQVASIWQELLGAPRIGREDDFFELGGTSLLVVRAIARVNAIYGVELSHLTLLESPTVAAFASCIQAVAP